MIPATGQMSQLGSQTVLSKRRVGLKVFKAGHCWHPECVVRRGGSLKSIAFPSTVACIEHPEHGLVLFDTGYSERFNAVTQSLPNILYRWVTPIELACGESLESQMRSQGLNPDDVRLIVLSHFHADHIAGLAAFPKAQLVCHRDAWQSIAHLKGLAAVRRGILPELLPKDFLARTRFLKPEEFTVRDPMLTPALQWQQLDLFGDDSVLVVPLPGHAAGHLGLLVRSHAGDMFFVADACWQTRALHENRLPNPVTRLLFDSFAEYSQTFARLRKLILAHGKDLLFVPCHCTEAWNSLTQLGLTVKVTQSYGNPS